MIRKGALEKRDRQMDQGPFSHLHQVHSGLENNLSCSVRKQHMAFCKDFMNGSEKWRGANNSSWAILLDHARLKKKYFYRIGFGFVWHTAIRINVLQWHSPPPPPAPLSRESALKQVQARECLSVQAGKQCAPTSTPSRDFQPRQGRTQGRCRENRRVCLWLRALNKSQ